MLQLFREVNLSHSWTSKDENLEEREEKRKMVKLCLNMIVKDEEHIIRQCFDNVRHLIDAIVILDTGSTDRTVSIMTDYMKEHNLPGLVDHDKWIDDFGYSRTKALTRAEKFCREQTKVEIPDRPISRREWSNIMAADTWYVLFMDADNEAKSDDGRLLMFDKQSLTEDIYVIKMRQGEAAYDYVWLVKVDQLGKKEWKWFGVIHEYVGPVDWSATRGSITGGYILSGRTGARNKDPMKYMKDALTLERAVLKEPNNERYWFYLAQSYRDAGDLGNSIRCYLKRAGMGGWHEEVYFSYYQAAILSLKRKPGKTSKPFSYLMKAIDAHPNRLEAPFILLDVAYQNKLFKFGWAWAQSFIDKPYPDKDLLFVDVGIHRWRFFDTAAICAYQAGDKEASRKLSKKALEYPKLDADNRKRIENNLTFC